MKRALVISGGGSKGAFAVGVLRELFATYPLLDFDIYVGSSTGSLVVSLASIGKMDTLEHLYTSLTNDDLLVRGNIVDKLNDTSIFDVTPLWSRIKENYTDYDYESLKTSNKKVFVNTVCLQTQELTVFTNDVDSINPSDYLVQQTLNANHFRRALLASCCQPVFMQPIQVGRDVPNAPNPDYQYIDGGVLEYVGIQMAIDAGATDILAIMLSADEPDSAKPQFRNLMEILGETIDILVSDVGKNDVKLVEQHNTALEYISAVKKKIKQSGIAQEAIEEYFRVAGYEWIAEKEPVRLIKIRPSQSLGGGPGGLNFDPNEMRGMLARGRMTFQDVAMNTDFNRFMSV